MEPSAGQAYPSGRDPNQQSAFYDDFVGRWLQSFVFGNPRVEAALTLALEHLPSGADLLDIGCGIGWTTDTLRRRGGARRAVGIDLSPVAIELAERLFGDPAVSFQALSVQALANAGASPAGAATLIDVYEHVPVEERPSVHAALDRLLASDAVLVVTCPSPSFQRYLAEHEPEELQPVDELVDRSDMERLAADLGGRLRLFRFVDIWRPGDYLHAVIERGNVPAPRSSVDLRGKRPWRARSALVRERLQVQVTQTGWLLPRRPGRTELLVALPKPNAVSETFVRAHCERLPANVHLLHGQPPPLLFDELDRPLMPTPVSGLTRIAARALRLPAQRLDRAMADRLLPRAALDRLIAAHLRKVGARAVLAEYGPTATEILGGCRLAGVPLVVQFHGYDAYRHDVWDDYAARYAELFRDAAALVAVSEAMRAHLLARGAPEEKLTVNPCGVDLGRFRPVDPGANPPRFVGVGRLVEKKAPHLTLLAFQKVLAQEPDARLVLVGDGPLSEVLRTTVAALGLSERVELLGKRNHTQVAQLMATARAFVQHSVRPASGDSEGTPVSVLEAGAGGLPVVATRHGGIPEVVVEGETGLLVDELDVDGMAAHMLSLAREPELARRLGAAAADHVRARYGLDRSLARLWSVIEGAIG